MFLLIKNFYSSTILTLHHRAISMVLELLDELFALNSLNFPLTVLNRLF